MTTELKISEIENCQEIVKQTFTFLPSNCLCSTECKKPYNILSIAILLLDVASPGYFLNIPPNKSDCNIIGRGRKEVHWDESYFLVVAILKIVALLTITSLIIGKNKTWNYITGDKVIGLSDSFQIKNKGLLNSQSKTVRWLIMYGTTFAIQVLTPIIMRVTYNLINGNINYIIEDLKYMLTSPKYWIHAGVNTAIYGTLLYFLEEKIIEETVNVLAMALPAALVAMVVAPLVAAKVDPPAAPPTKEETVYSENFESLEMSLSGKQRKEYRDGGTGMCYLNNNKGKSGIDLDRNELYFGTNHHACFSIPKFNGSSLGFKAIIMGNIVGKDIWNPLADGFSFNYGDASLETFGKGEEGMSKYEGNSDIFANNNLSFEVDLYGSTKFNDQGFSISGIINKQDQNTSNSGNTDWGYKYRNFLYTSPTLDGPLDFEITLTWIPNSSGGTARFEATGFVDEEGESYAVDLIADTPNFYGNDEYNFFICSRTGGLEYSLGIDSIEIKKVV